MVHAKSDLSTSPFDDDAPFEPLLNKPLKAGTIDDVRGKLMEENWPWVKRNGIVLESNKLPYGRNANCGRSFLEAV